jgi:hypothetical protein
LQTWTPAGCTSLIFKVSALLHQMKIQVGVASLPAACASVVGYTSDFGTEASVPATPAIEWQPYMDAVYTEHACLAVLRQHDCVFLFACICQVCSIMNVKPYPPFTLQFKKEVHNGSHSNLFLASCKTKLLPLTDADVKFNSRQAKPAAAAPGDLAQEGPVAEDAWLHAVLWTSIFPYAIIIPGVACVFELASFGVLVLAHCLCLLSLASWVLG